MKSMSNLHFWMAFIAMSVTISIPSAHGFLFSRPEIRLIEEMYVLDYQNEVDLAFDPDGNVHVVWTDSREGPSKIYGNTVLNSGIPLLSYKSYGGISADNQASPSIVSNILDPTHLYMICAIPTVSAKLAAARYDITFLPGSVNPQDQPETNLPPSYSADGLATIWVGDRISFAFEYDGSIYYGEYVPGTSTWSLLGVIPGLIPDIELVSPCFAKDEDGFIYLCYTRIDLLLPGSILIARRSSEINSLFNGFHTEREIGFSPDMTGFVNSIAAKGSMGNMDLHVAVIYSPNSVSPALVTCISDHNGDWSSNLLFNGGTSVLNSALCDYVGGVDIDYDVDGRLYAVWTDDRNPMLFQLYGNMSYDFGNSFGVDRLIDTGGWEVVEQPRIAVGYTPGDIAIAYIHREGSDPHHPFLLVSQSEFYDSCDGSPSAYWDGYAGVNNDSILYHGLTGSGSSYRLTTHMNRGQLIRDYGIEEQQGVLELYFYDPLTPVPGAADFYVTINNDNIKGVIRMLGVRNDTTQSNYSYFNGSQWIIWGGPRSVGWHHIIVRVDDTGIRMELETSPGTYLLHQDAAFTSFTSIEIEGGSDSDPYNVDDIRVETDPLNAVPPVVPVDTALPLMIAMLVFGGIMVRFRRF